MSLISTLYVRLALTMLVLFIAVGGVVLYLNQQTSSMYSLEMTQRINRDIALHAAEDMPIMKGGQVNSVALKELAHHVMFINPIVEVYLLDPSGKVLSHALPYETVLLDQVDMTPLHAFLDETAELPIFGDDPRSPDALKVFSVSPVIEDGAIVAYLYTVLNGKAHDSLRESLQDSYNMRTGASSVLASLLVAVVAALLLFALLTKRLRKLRNAVRVYREGSFQGSIDITPPAPARDEIDELTLAISDMSQRIEQQFTALQEVDATRRELVANVSHDLRTPLASLQGYLEMAILKEQDLTADEKRDCLQTAYKHSRRLNDLIGELFELAKLESGTVEPQWEEFPLMELIQDLVQDHTLLANEREITLAAHSENMAVSVNADIALIHRVLENLLQNALRHTASGGEITITVRDDQDRVWIEVADNGEGIASHDIPRIFDRFYRPENNDAQSGHGLGLAIVKRIIDLHRSQVAVASAPSCGAAFTFWLPQAA